MYFLGSSSYAEEMLSKRGLRNEENRKYICDSTFEIVDVLMTYLI